MFDFNSLAKSAVPRKEQGICPKRFYKVQEEKKKLLSNYIIKLLSNYISICFLKLKIFISFLIIKGSKAYIIQYRRFNKSPPNHPKIYILLYFLSDFFFSYYS